MLQTIVIKIWHGNDVVNFELLLETEIVGRYVNGKKPTMAKAAVSQE